MHEEEDQTSAVDVSIAFFICVTVLLVFVKFNVAPEQPDRQVPSLGEAADIVESVPSTWSALSKRGGFAILYENNLTLLNLNGIATELADDALLSEDANYATFSPGTGSSPREFQLRLAFSPANLPESWVREIIVIGAPLDPALGAVPCSWDVSQRSLLTVWIVPSDQEPDVNALMQLAGKCNLSLRPQIIRAVSDSGRSGWALALNADSYTAKKMFR